MMLFFGYYSSYTNPQPDRNMTKANIIAAYNLADNLENEVTNFFCASVGKTINSLEEFCLLTQWLDAIEAAIVAALSIRDFIGDRDFCKMHDECNMWLANWAAAQ